jgi:hypothetical protein
VLKQLRPFWSSHVKSVSQRHRVGEVFASASLRLVGDMPGLGLPRYQSVNSGLVFRYRDCELV